MRPARAGVYAGVLLIAGIALPALCTRLASLAGAWLIAGEEPRPSDLIVVLSGGARERLLTSLDLYRAGLAPAIMITDPDGYPDMQMRELSAAGVPVRALVPPPSPARTTVEDALCIRELTVRKGLKSILVVTSPIHCRRARLTLSRTFSDLEVRVTVTPSRSLYLDPGRWWRSREGWAQVPAEFLKLIGAWMIVSDLGPVGHDRNRK